MSRFLAIVLGSFLVATTACGGGSTHAGGPGGGGDSAALRAYPALAFVPANPTYLLTAHTFGDGQRLGDELWHVMAATIGGGMAPDLQLAGVAMFDPAAVAAALGVDPAGGFAIYSTDDDPTLVAHMTDPAKLAAFMPAAHGGLAVEHSTVDGIDVSTMRAGGKATVEWAVVADGWLLAHVAHGAGPADPHAWLAAARGAHGAVTTDPDFVWAQAAARPRGVTGDTQLLGFTRLDRVAALSGDAQLASCVGSLAPAQRIALGLHAEARHRGAALAVDVGGSEAAIQAQVRPILDGWAAAARDAPLAAQWNLDLAATGAAFAGCHPALQQLAQQTGLRAGRAFLLAFDPGDLTGKGAASVDLADRQFVGARLDDVLDRIPMRSIVESRTQLGPFAGHTINMPTVPKIQYALTDDLFLAGIGGGVLDTAIGTGARVPGPAASLDLVPGGLSTDAWDFMLDAMGVKSPAARKASLAELARWARVHLEVVIGGHAITLYADAERT